MPVDTVTVQYVNQPRAGRKMGSIKTVDGKYFGVFPELLPKFGRGGVYEIEYEQTIGQDGNTYNTLKRILSIKGLPAISSSNSSNSGARPASVGGHSHTAAVEMFVMGVIGRAYEGTGMLPDESVLVEHVRALRSAWERGFASEQKSEEKPLSQELNDQIPF